MTLKKEEIIGPAEATSKFADENLHEYNYAQSLLEKQNAQELFVLYEKAVKARGEALKTMLSIANHYLGEKDHPLYQPDSEVIGAMERVALAAIQLAKESINGKSKK